MSEIISDQSNITDVFVKNTISLANSHFSNVVYDHFLDCFLDYVGCTLAGSRFLSEKTDCIIDSGLFGEGKCTVLGSARKLEMVGAAFINAICSHVIELDDGHKLGAIHPAAPVFSGLLAMAQNENISYADFIRGAIVGYEAIIRISSSIQPDHRNRGFHTTGTCGAIGVALGIAAALHYDFKQTKSALTAAASCAGGVNEMMQGNSQLKPFNAGKAAYDGLLAAYIGKTRFESPDDVIGGKRGFFAVMTDKFNDSYLRDFDSTTLLGMTNYFKSYAACRHCHAAIEATLKICQEHEIDYSKIERINVGMYESGISGHEHQFVDSINSAKMSIPYCVSVSIIDKNAGMEEFDDAHINRKDIIGLAQKVFVYEDPSLTALIPKKRASVVEIKTAFSSFVQQVYSSKGDMDNPMTRNDLIEKFENLAQYGGLQFSAIKKATDAILYSSLSDSLSKVLDRIWQ